MKHAAWITLAVAACGAPSTPSTPPAKPHIDRIERGLLPPVQVQGEDVRWSIADRMREHKVPAVSIAVFDNYQLVWAKAYGVADPETGARATEDTIFLAGSISKSVNALGVLLAAVDGTLALDAPINDLLVSWKLPDNELTRVLPVTLRRLLSHTAGTTVHGFPGYAAGEAIPTVTQILDGEKPANTPPIRVDLAPGTKFRYSGGGITISQLALTDRSKRPYPQILADRVLGPLGMVHSTFEQALPPERLSHAAAGNGRDGRMIAGKRHAYPEMAAAGLWTTPSDLARFFLEIARARARKPSRVPAGVATQMTTKVIDIEGGGGAIGLGVFLTDRNGTPFFGHGGADEGFQADAVVSLDGGYGVVVMANSDNGFQIFPEIERAVFAEYGWKGVDTPIVRVAMEPAQRARFAGRFLGGRWAATITVTGDRLEIHGPFEPPVELIPVAADQVVLRDNGFRLRLGATGSIELTPPQGPTLTMARLADGARHPLLELEQGRFDAAVAAWRDQLRDDPKAADGEDGANLLGYQLMERDLPKAIEVLRLIATVFPASSNAHDSLGEAYAKAGDKARAITEYEQAIATLDADARLPAASKPDRRRHAEAELGKLRAP